MFEETKPLKQSDYSNYRLWTYEKPKETNTMSSEPELLAFGLNYKNDFIIFDLYSLNFLSTIQRMDLNLLPGIYGTIITGEQLTQSLILLHRALSEKKRIKNNKRKIRDIIKNSCILPAQLLSDYSYQSGIKVNRILELEKKKHQTLITCTVLEKGRERISKFSVYDTINDYEGLLQALEDYKKKSENICPYCGGYMENGYCENCFGKEPIQGEPIVTRKKIISVILYFILAILSVILIYILPTKIELMIVVKILLIYPAIGFTYAACSTILKMKKEKDMWVE